MSLAGPVRRASITLARTGSSPIRLLAGLEVRFELTLSGFEGLSAVLLFFRPTLALKSDGIRIVQRPAGHHLIEGLKEFKAERARRHQAETLERVPQALRLVAQAKGQARGSTPIRNRFPGSYFAFSSASRPEF
jgi:hypothetical protein